MICFKCGVDKPLTEYSSNGKGLYKRRCKPCRSEDELARYTAKPVEERRRVIRRVAEWISKNQDKWKAYSRKWRRSRKEHINLKTQMRRRRCREHMPPWADKAAIRSFYKRAADLTKQTGVKYEVDHIVPLNGPTVSGLHCEANLQILTELENKRKTNAVWPDMPI